MPYLALSQKSHSTCGQLTYVKIKATRSVGRLNLSSIHDSDYRGKTQSSGTTLPVACGHVHLATSLSHVNHVEILTTLCSTAVNWSTRPPRLDQLTSGPLQGSYLVSLEFCHFLKKFLPVTLYMRFYKKSSTGNTKNSLPEQKSLDFSSTNWSFKER